MCKADQSGTYWQHIRVDKNHKIDPRWLKTLKLKGIEVVWTTPFCEVAAPKLVGLELPGAAQMQNAVKGKMLRRCYTGDYEVSYEFSHFHVVSVNWKLTDLSKAQTAMALAAQQMVVDTDPQKSSEDRGREVLPGNRVHRMIQDDRKICKIDRSN